MEFKCVPFGDLSVFELYEIYKARSLVFVVEQTCVYNDVDDIDPKSFHLILRDNEELVAYLRFFEKEEGVMQIGRVLTVQRGKGYGAALLHRAVSLIDEMGYKEIFLEAQCYATGFYEREGFVISSEPFDEDGIMHVAMTRK